MTGLSQSKWAEPSSRSRQASDPVNNVTSSLSGAAQTFAPSVAPSSDISTYDEFTRTGADQDDLFDDIIPESMQTRPQDDIFTDDITPDTQPISQELTREQTDTQKQRGNDRARGRGRGRGRESRPDRTFEKRSSAIVKSAQTDSATGPQAPEDAPTGPKKEPTAAVRGDRFATGGVRKPKLSESELAEKMAQISMKNASLTAAHARAEADAANFAQREAQAKVEASQRQESAKVRAREERKDRQQMMGEREKNRLRKLKAIEGREWDAEKNEDDFSKGGRFDKKSIANDNTEYTDGSEYLLREQRGSKRGNRHGNNTANSVQRVPRADEFPALNAGNKPATSFGDINNENDKANEAVRSWADQVESSTAAAA